jgi:hypothetical protein
MVADRLGDLLWMDDPSAGSGQFAKGLARFGLGFLMAEALGRAGRMTDGLAAVEGARVWAESTGERWAISEVLLRLKGELSFVAGRTGSHGRR